MTEQNMKKAISEIEKAMERWHLGRDNDDETLREINRILLELGLLSWHNQCKHEFINLDSQFKKCSKCGLIEPLNY